MSKIFMILGSLTIASILGTLILGPVEGFIAGQIVAAFMTQILD